MLLEQAADYRRGLFPAGVPVVAVEAGRGQSLQVLAGTDGLVYGIDSFGKSAPFADLAAHFGFTPDQLATRVLTHVRNASI